MARRAPRRNVTKTRSLETLESRVVMSADPLLSLHSSLIEEAPVMTTHSAPEMTTHVTPGYDPNADFWAGGGLFEVEQDDLGERIEQTLYEANQQTGQTQMLAKYGFTGTGQTVAVIDTGIAYNHYALGGGVGANYKVVGGWDFTENEWNFYDDQGPKSAHGTHVAGIIGADGDGIHSGVSTGVDLVGLRVFDDAGNGYFHWVEQALQWVYTNRNSYANPITTVNLSLGTEWNSLSNPAWAMLENEFAQLESVGIFISVSAGNSFTNYNTKGLSYPAASDYVIPVMATDGNGQLSYFSQRADGAIAAPGRYITSTVPDYAANDADTIDDDWLSMSGTSMAAPYVAGASTLIRQAMQFVGQTGIDQWDIYNHMMATADTFYDSATATNYKRLNLAAAIDALMPVDDFGSSQVDAYNLGTLNDSGATPLANLSGVISTLDDADCFKFVAGASGTVTISATQSHELTAQWQVWGASSWTVNQAGECVIDVVAGQTYTFSIATSDGLGYYDLSVELESNFAAIEWGSIGTQETRIGLSVNGETWYQVTAGRTGYFTAETIAQSGSASVAIYNAQMGALTSASARAEFQATAGQTFYLRVTGSSPNFNLRMTNALTVSGGVASLLGTTGNDALTYSAGATNHTIGINGVTYSIAAASAAQVNLNGAGGVDSVTATGTSGVDTVTAGYDSGQIVGSGYQASWSQVEQTTVNSAGGNDTATINGSAGVDSLVAGATSATMTRTTTVLSIAVNGFKRVDANGMGGIDSAELLDGATSDRLVVGKNYGLMRSLTGEFYNYAMGFENIVGRSTAGGADVATLNGTTGNEVFVMRFKESSVTDATQSFKSEAIGFTTAYTYSNGGDDVADLYDTTGDDQYIAKSAFVVMTDATSSYYNSALGFKNANGHGGSGGFDRAFLYDSTGNDSLGTGERHGRLQANDASFNNYAEDFDDVLSYSILGGYDTAEMIDSAAADTVVAIPMYVTMTNAPRTYWHLVYGFDTTLATSMYGGADTATLRDSTGDDVFVATPYYATLSNVAATYANTVYGFGTVTANASTGFDTATLYDGATDDRMIGSPTFVLLRSVTNEFNNYAVSFDRVIAYATAGGVDYATLNDSAGNDTLTFIGGVAALGDVGGTFLNSASGFEGVFANSNKGGVDSADLRDTSGDDTFYGSGNTALLTTQASGFIKAMDYESVRAESSLGGNDDADVSATDYVFSQVGAWV
jgi:subtilisin family serine protease